MNASQAVAVYSAVHAAIERRAALPIVYASGGEIVKERVIRPERIVVGPHGSDLIIATDSLREGVCSFRIDRVVAVAVQPKERY